MLSVLFVGRNPGHNSLVFISAITFALQICSDTPSPIMSSVDVPPDHPPNEPQTIKEEIIEGQVDTIESNARYLAYANRFRTIAVASSRYLAYTSGVSPPNDLG